MNYIGYIIPPLCVALIMFFVNRWYNHREKKQTELSRLTSLVTDIAARMDGIESFSRRLTSMEGRIEAQEKICESHHKWDGLSERRQVIA